LTVKVVCNSRQVFNSLPPKCFVLATEFKSQGETNIYTSLLAPLALLAIHNC